MPVCSAVSPPPGHGQKKPRPPQGRAGLCTGIIVPAGLYLSCLSFAFSLPLSPNLPVRSVHTRWTIGRVIMEVNLRKLYPTLYSADVLVEVSDEVFEAIRTFERAEAA